MQFAFLISLLLTFSSAQDYRDLDPARVQEDEKKPVNDEMPVIGDAKNVPEIHEINFLGVGRHSSDALEIRRKYKRIMSEIWQKYA